MYLFNALNLHFRGAKVQISEQIAKEKPDFSAKTIIFMT